MRTKEGDERLAGGEPQGQGFETKRGYERLQQLNQVMHELKKVLHTEAGAKT